MIRNQKEYEGNPIGLPKETAIMMARELDRHLSSFITLYQQYHKHHWLVEGPQFRDLHLFFENNYTEVHEQYDAIAERLTIMGIAPTCHPENMYKLSYIDHEPEGVFRIRESLQNDMAAEKSIVIELHKSIKKAFELDDFGTKNLLEGILYKTEDRAHHIEHFLGEDTIFVPDAHYKEELVEA